MHFLQVSASKFEALAVFHYIFVPHHNVPTVTFFRYGVDHERYCQEIVTFNIDHHTYHIFFLLNAEYGKEETLK